MGGGLGTDRPILDTVSVRPWHWAARCLESGEVWLEVVGSRGQRGGPGRACARGWAMLFRVFSLEAQIVSEGWAAGSSLEALGEPALTFPGSRAACIFRLRPLPPSKPALLVAFLSLHHTAPLCAPPPTFKARG